MKKSSNILNASNATWWYPVIKTIKWKTGDKNIQNKVKDNYQWIHAKGKAWKSWLSSSEYNHTKNSWTQFILFIQSQASARYFQFLHCLNLKARQWRGAPWPWKRGSTQEQSPCICRKTKDQCKSSYTSQVGELPWSHCYNLSNQIKLIQFQNTTVPPANQLWISNQVVNAKKITNNWKNWLQKTS